MTLDKSGARQAAFARRKVAHSAGLDGAAQALLRDHLAPFRGLPLVGYMPIRTEIDPLPVMEDWSHHSLVGVPVIPGPDQPLTFHQWTPGCALTVGAFGALIPDNAAEVVPRVVIVPLVAFDRAGNRLGYGGGFYDRTLEKLRARGPVHAVGYAYGAQEAEALPLEPTDQPLDAIVTEGGVLTF